MNNNMNEQNNQRMNNTFPTNGSGTFVNNASQSTNQSFMNNNINERNNQRMNNTFPTNGSGTFVNNASQSTNQSFMNNNINEQNNQRMNNTIPTNGSGTFVDNSVRSTNETFTSNNINQSVNPNYNQTFINNKFDNNNLNQNKLNNANNISYATNNNGKNNNKSKKKILILAIILGIVVVILILTSLLSDSSKNNIPNIENAKKTLTCTIKVEMFGVYYDQTYELYINDESMSIKQIEKIDLKKTQVEGKESEWAQSRIDGMSEECKSMPGCKFDYNYSKGNYFESIVFLGEETFNEGVQGLTAEEIYESQKARFEGGKVDGLNFTCSGNGETSTNNQSVYKTIDYNSYTGDSKSTEFDILYNKKVTFTNVPRLPGDILGEFDKMIMCDNESSFTLEKDAKYTVTGIVTYNEGTVIVKLKDCTVIKTE